MASSLRAVDGNVRGMAVRNHPRVPGKHSNTTYEVAYPLYDRWAPKDNGLSITLLPTVFKLKDALGSHQRAQGRAIRPSRR